MNICPEPSLLPASLSFEGCPVLPKPTEPVRCSTLGIPQSRGHRLAVEAHLHACVHVHVRVHVYVHVYVHASVHVHVHASVHVHMYVHACMCMHMCMHVCM